LRQLAVKKTSRICPIIRSIAVFARIFPASGAKSQIFTLILAQIAIFGKKNIFFDNMLQKLLQKKILWCIIKQ